MYYYTIQTSFNIIYRDVICDLVYRVRIYQITNNEAELIHDFPIESYDNEDNEPNVSVVAAHVDIPANKLIRL